MPELVGVKTCQADEFQEKVEWMMARGFLTESPITPSWSAASSVGWRQINAPDGESPGAGSQGQIEDGEALPPRAGALQA